MNLCFVPSINHVIKTGASACEDRALVGQCPRDYSWPVIDFSRNPQGVTLTGNTFPSFNSAPAERKNVIYLTFAAFNSAGNNRHIDRKVWTVAVVGNRSWGTGSVIFNLDCLLFVSPEV